MMMARDSRAGVDDGRGREASETDSQRAKALPLRDPGSALPLVPARMVNEVLYCERLMYLEWVHGEWDSNRFTADGDRVHKRVDRKPRALKANEAERPTPGNDSAGAANDEGDRPYQARSVWLSSERLGVTAKLDVVDVEDGQALAVEYKRGKRPALPEGAYLPERAQLCVHVLLLREHGYRCDAGEIYFAGDHQRTRVEITDELIETTQQAIRRVHELASGGQLPPPLENSPKCTHCSLNTICLPDEVNFLRGKRLPLAEPQDPTEPARAEAPRKLLPPRSPKVPLYVTKQGAAVRLDGERLTIFANNEKLAEARLPNTSHIALFGNAQISTQAIRSLMSRGIGVHFFSYGGAWAGACLGADSNNVELRLAQYQKTRDSAVCLQLSKRWVHSKIRNCRTLLRRNAKRPVLVALNELKQFARKVLGADSIATLLGLEGTAARAYFSAFTEMLTDAACAEGFSFEGRSRRPPRDALNALLSFSYSLLVKDTLAACRVAGLDPLLGFYHQPRFGRPSLALDLMEEFRPILADSAVIHAVNNGVVQANDFVVSGGAYALSDHARRRFIKTYEQRMEQEIQHPLFGYRISYRRVLDVQARLLTRVLLGELDEYPIFSTR